MTTLLISAGFPVVIFLIVIYKKDTEKEPPGLLIKCFIWGCISTVPIIFVEMFFGSLNAFQSVVYYAFYESFIVAAVVEEGFKFIFLYRITWKHKEFDQHYDGIVYAVFISLGFAFIENIAYILGFGTGVAFMRAILSIPGHGLFGVAMGYFFARAKFSGPGEKKILWLSYLVPVFLHGMYNFFLSLMEGTENGFITLLLFAGFVVFIILLWRFGIKNIRRQLTKDRGDKTH